MNVSGTFDPKRRAHLLRLWKSGATFKAISAEYGGTPNGVRSTIRKMRSRGQAPDRIRVVGKNQWRVAE